MSQRAKIVLERNKKLFMEKARRYRRLIKFHLQMLACRLSIGPEGYLPNALCVGVPKAATTWLYARLNLHPEVLLPNGKELHFFNERYDVKASNAVFNHRKAKLLWGYEFNLNRLADWRWYKRQFKGGLDKCKIDITPTYCRVSINRITQIKQWLPDAKILLIIRNPI
jgi:hypothetical protein